ncbi:MAG: DinB family protein [Gemmatimonadaceae bacterium]
MRGLTFDVLMAYTRGETRHWFEWLQSQPAGVLDVPIGKDRMATVRDVMVHTFAVELRCAERLLGEDVTPFDSLPVDSLSAIFAIGARARDKMDQYLSRATSTDLHEIVVLPSASGEPRSASAYRVAGHFFLHGIRHWAQIATALRQAGYGVQWPHDLLSSEMED